MITLYDNDITLPSEHRYTLKEIVEGFGLDIWDKERPFPIFDEEYRETLQNRIYDHFAYRRIATSTPQQFVFYLNRRMREQMPAYNEIYKKMASDGFDPYLTSEAASTGKQDSTSNSKTHATSQGESTSITSNTPASFLENAEDPKYMSSLAKTVSESTNDSESGSTSSANAENLATGRSGYLGDAILNSLASGFLNTDLMVCDMLEPLFMQIWTDQPL